MSLFRQPLPLLRPRLTCPLRGWLALGLLLGVLVFAGRLPAADVPSQPAVITSAADFWNLTDAEKQVAHPLRMELVVYYYDPAWRLLYAKAADTATYFPVQGKPIAIKSGQRVLLEGKVVPADGFDGGLITASVLADGALPAPLATAGRLEEPAAFNGRWVAIEGYVLSQSEPDTTHVEARMWCEGLTVNLTILISGTEPVPQLVGARVRIRGVYDAALDLLGKVQRLQFWTVEPGKNLEVLSWLADDERFKLPRTMIDQLAAARAPWVRVVGEVRAQDLGKSLTVRDESGQIVVQTTQPELLLENSAVELVGRPGQGEFSWTLQEALYRKAGPSAGQLMTLQSPGQIPLRLRLAEQVLELPPEQAEKRYPVTLRGTVTWSDERADFFYLQDASGGVRIRRQPGQGTAPAVGSALILTGFTARGAYVSEVEMQEIANQGTFALPSVRSVTLEQTLSGAEEGQRVEMRGFVRQVSHEGGWTRLNLTTYTGEFVAYLPFDDTLAYLKGALVRVRGVCTALANANREFTEIRLWMQNREAVVVDEPSPSDPFTVPLQAIAGLRQSTAKQFSNHRVRVAGMVLLHEVGRYLYLQDASGGLFVLTREAGQLNPGDWVEIVGFPGRAGNRLVIREAIWRPAVPGPAITPRPLTDVHAPLPEADARLVRVAAVLRQAVSEAGKINLTLQAGDTVSGAVVRAAPGWTPPDIGSRVEITGVYVLEYDEYRQPRGFRLELRSPIDVKLVSSPPWWTVGRTWSAIGVLGLITLLIVGWGVALRRRVREQTEQIRRQLEKEARLQGELERSSRLESLGVLAGGIAHDFNNLLTAVLGNLGLAAMDKRVMAAAGDCITEAERGARRARDITQQLLTFAKGGDPVRTAVLLPDIVSEAASFARHGSNVRFDFDYPPDLPPGNVDAGQISRVIHNLVINAVQAMPDGGVVRIALASVSLGAGEVDALDAGPYLRLTIADTGKGISPEHLSRIFDPYFSTKTKAGNSGLGLATVRSIIKKHNGHIEVDSRVGQGTTFRIWLPVAQQEAVAASRPPQGGTPIGPARILVMDDEDAIRRVAGRMLSLAGHETVFTTDGAEAIRAYAAARQAGRPFDLVIFDLTVPGGMGGKEALQELLKLDPGVRAIASSGYSNDPIMANPHAYGFRTSLPKPYDIPDLVRAIEDARRD